MNFGKQPAKQASLLSVSLFSPNRGTADHKVQSNEYGRSRNLTLI